MAVSGSIDRIDNADIDIVHIDTVHLDTVHLNTVHLNTVHLNTVHLDKVQSTHNVQTEKYAMTGLHHGGQLNLAAEKYSIAKEQWLDLSTGINPHSFLSAERLARYSEQLLHCAAQLPEDNDGLNAVCAEYLKTESALVTPGSQWSISRLPTLLPKNNASNTVLVPQLGYREHAKTWQQAGFNIVWYQDNPTEQQLKDCHSCVIINPNNPSGFLHTRQQLQIIAQTLAKNNAWLIVDEAFIESSSQPEHSVANLSLSNLIVLRSLGKFYGLAGCRVGALCGPNQIIAALDAALEPWAIANPSRLLAKKAWSDTSWQNQTHELLKQQSNALENLLSKVFSGSSSSEIYWSEVSPNQVYSNRSESNTSEPNTPCLSAPVLSAPFCSTPILSTPFISTPVLHTPFVSNRQHCYLFKRIVLSKSDSEQLFTHLAKQGILIRNLWMDEIQPEAAAINFGVRFGLPDSAAAFTRLESALMAFSRNRE